MCTGKPKKILWLAQLWHLLDCSGLEPNLQDLNYAYIWWMNEWPNEWVNATSVETVKNDPPDLCIAKQILGTLLPFDQHLWNSQAPLGTRVMHTGWMLREAAPFAGAHPSFRDLCLPCATVLLSWNVQTPFQNDVFKCMPQIAQDHKGNQMHWNVVIHIFKHKLWW